MLLEVVGFFCFLSSMTAIQSRKKKKRRKSVCQSIDILWPEVGGSEEGVCKFQDVKFV